MWIKTETRNILLNLQSLRTVRCEPNDPVNFMLIGYYHGLDEKHDVTIDYYDTDADANSALAWFFLLMTGQIDKDLWEKGRHDAEFRNAALQGGDHVD